jgi:5-carboxymethyl-2-hydroxymuconate isomerase
MHGAMVECGIFPLGGIRVRALRCDSFAIADRHPENAFVDMVLRIGAGRSEADKSAAGARIMTAAEEFFSKRFATPHFALSLEMVEINPDLSWKTNSIHERLGGKR